MKVALLGGYGVFGALLAELLVRDGHDVVVAGRSFAKAEACAARIGATALAVDLTGDLSPLFAVAPDVVIDAAGPYQAYGDDPYRLARAAIDAGANYLDLSDAASFTSGIARLDAPAKAAGLWALSGASSVPGLSSIVAAELARGLGPLELIDISIHPGNRAPRGASVIASIVGGVGRPFRARRGGVWRDVRGWTDRRRRALGPGLTRVGYLVDVPDVSLFPDRFGARSVVFRAGLELGVMNAALAGLAMIRRIWRAHAPPWALTAIRRLSNLLRPFGTDRGGMAVTAIGGHADAPLRREWVLIAEAGAGPNAPGIVARTLLRRADRIEPGARPCLAEAGLEEVEAALSDLSIRTQRYETAAEPLFQSVLGDRWATLAAPHRALHRVQDVESFSGAAQVTRGRGLPARLVAWIFGFPPTSENASVAVVKTRTDAGEVWERNFDGARFRSHLSPSLKSGRINERFLFLRFELEPLVDGGRLTLPVRRGWAFGLPLPGFLLPKSEAAEFVEDGAFHFDISISMPLGAGAIVRYRGTLTPDDVGNEAGVAASA